MYVHMHGLAELLTELQAWRLAEVLAEWLADPKMLKKQKKKNVNKQ